MRRTRVGLVIEDDSVAVAAIRKGGSTEYFRLVANEALPARLEAQLSPEDWAESHAAMTRRPKPRKR